MITCKFNGRLGNNMFQIANVINTSIITGYEFALPLTTEAGHRGILKSDLSMFDYQFNRLDTLTINNYHDPTFTYTPPKIENDITYHGFYQSWKYFDSIKSELVSKYFAPSKNVIDRMDNYDIPTNCLGISVRRGDYLMLSHNHCVLSTDYYQSAINKFFNSSNTNGVYIFSDDIEWCKFVFGKNVFYVEDTIGTQLFLMTKMKNLILSNSTFAWWGAYLNTNNGVIVAPSPWFGKSLSNIDTSDLYCKNWFIHNH